MDNVLISQKAELLGKRIRGFRKALGITQKELARISGISVFTISNLESGMGTGISFENLLSILDAFGIVNRIDNLVPEVNREFIAGVLRKNLDIS